MTRTMQIQTQQRYRENSKYHEHFSPPPDVRGLGVTREADDGKGDEGKVWGRWGDEGEEGMSRGGSESI